jgi:hypothetical protein
MYGTCVYDTLPLIQAYSPLRKNKGSWDSRGCIGGAWPLHGELDGRYHVKKYTKNCWTQWKRTWARTTNVHNVAHHFGRSRVRFLVWNSGVMEFQERFCCKPHTCFVTAYSEGSPTKYSHWAAVHLAHFWKHFWNSCCGIVFSASLFFFLDVFSVLKSSSL